MTNHFISSAIPYVNAQPHLGFALELLIADTLARYQRNLGSSVHFVTGADENSLKNVLAAEKAGVETRHFVQANTASFHELNRHLNIDASDFVRTSVDPRHQKAVEEIWRRCKDNGDIYESAYEGLYCVGCEQFYTEKELEDGRCPEHGGSVESISEQNWFFRLSRYQDTLKDLIEKDQLKIQPESRRREIQAFLEQPLQDLSISRSNERARGWGIPVPDDSTQRIYVWFDALVNYLTSVGFVTAPDQFEARWQGASRIQHVVGKGIARFHAVYWPAFLLSAGVRLPDEIIVHGYVTVDGAKISKSQGNPISPVEANDRHNGEALRYFLLRHIGAQRDGDFSWSRFDEVYRSELANDLGNLVSRVVTLGRKHGIDQLHDQSRSDIAAGLGQRVHAEIQTARVDGALREIFEVVSRCNSFLSEREPWALAKAGDLDECRTVVTEVYLALYAIADQLVPFLPKTSARITEALNSHRSVRLFPVESARLAQTKEVRDECLQAINSAK